MMPSGSQPRRRVMNQSIHTIGCGTPAGSHVNTAPRAPSAAGVVGVLVPALAFLMAMDLPLSQALSGVLGRFIGPVYLLLLPTSLLAIGSILLSRRYRVSISLLCWLLSGLASIVVSVALATHPTLGLFDGWLGYISPVLVVAAYAAAGPALRMACLRGFLSGVLVAWLVGLLLLAWSWHMATGEATVWASSGFFNQVLTWRYEMGRLGYPYMHWMGNANKASDVILLIILLLPVLASRTGRPVGRWFANGLIVITILGIVHLLAMGSRLTLFFLPVVLFLVTGFFNRGSRGRKWLIAILMVALLMAAAQASGLVERVILNRSGVSGATNETVLGSFESQGGRLDQWRGILGSWRAEPVGAIRGVGVGEYGLARHGYPEAGTHNFFLDRVFEGGLIAAAFAAAAVAIGMLQAIRLPRGVRWHMMLGIGFLALVMMREFSPAYLFRTSLPGVLACFLISPRSVTQFAGRWILKRASSSPSST